MMHRNQTYPVSGLSPAQVIFGRQLRDHLPLQPEKFQLRAEWRQEADQREKTYMKRHLMKHEQLSSTARTLPPLKVGDCVAIQDKSDPSKAGKRNKTGIGTDSLGFQWYGVKVDGSNNLTSRNRSHLRKIIPFINEQMKAAQTLQPPSLLQTRSHTREDVAQGSQPIITPVIRPKQKLPIKEKWIVRKDWQLLTTPPSLTTVTPTHTVTTVQAIKATYTVPSSGEGGIA